MKDRAIFIVAWNRPRYLRVCLESLARCRKVAHWDLWVDYDGGSTADFACCEGVMDHYAVIRKSNLGCVRHPTDVLKTALEFGYNFILYCEDDVLLRPDALEYVLESKSNTGLVSCYRFDDGRAKENAIISNSPFQLPKSTLREIVDFMDRKLYLGLPNVCDGNRPITEAVKYHDICWYQWAKINKVVFDFSGIQLALNFGYSGMNFRYRDFDPIAFSGPPESWFDSVIRTCAISTFVERSRTPGFVYS